MIKDKTVLILGSGASVPYFYPTMDDLRNDIIGHFDGYYSRFLPKDIDERKQRAAIRRVMRFIDRYDKSSLIIDEFLADDDNKDVRKLGKLAIACSIVEFEKKSKFRQESQREEGDWYTLLYRELYGSLPREEKYKFSKHKLSIITFNYDRSLEYFLYDSLVNTMPSKKSLIIDQLNSWDIIHIYGQLAILPWQNPKDWTKDPLTIDYRKIETGDQHHRCSANIDVMFESRSNHPRVKKAKEIILNSKRIFFLGFGFDEFNLKVLGFPNIIRNSHDIYWTTYGLTARKIAEISNLFSTNKALSSSRVYLKSNCKDFIDQYLF